MKKFTLPVIFFVVVASCKKDNIITAQTENSNQLLTKVIMTSDVSAISYSTNYGYNNAGKIIAEGNKTYYRDDKQRIVRILDPGTFTNRSDIQVYYSDSNPDKVFYTICNMIGNVTDSVAYLHDDNGRLIKTMSYVSYFSDRKTPDTTFLAEYNIFHYDVDDNLVQMSNFKTNNGNLVLCSQYNFEGYTRSINPLYTDDEVRIMEFSWEGTLNSSINNFTRIGDYTKIYEYRTDGRPRSCVVKQNGANDFKFTFEYE